MRSLLAYGTTSALEEKLTLRIKADNSGDVYIPIAWYSSDGSQDCEYNWMVSIDWNTAVEYSGVWSSTGKIRVGYGLTPLSVHTVIITPKVDEYSWLRAFGYKGTDIAPTLINIISDKSYKGYALSGVFAWNYYKAYQYYWCVNLINTDEELLPDTLEIIWDNYRYYEYSGCTSLVSNADERILKTVKVIWDNYRAYQYENCTNINRIYMRAINWASVWNNYRQNQYTGASNDKKPMDIYIEWGIEEGWDWWLANWSVKNIYVYDGLVSDYQTKLSTITSSKIKKNADWDGYEYEFIEYVALADSTGKIRIPVGWYSTSFTQDCAYDWMVSIDGDEAVEITGTGWATYVSVWSGLTEWTEHRVVIKPKTVAYWWGRAFWFHTTWAQAYIKEFIHDSYKCFASNRTETGAHYKHWTFTWCTNLINSYEKLPTSVTTIWDAYMSECYAGCTSLQAAFYEVLHKWCTLWENYRYHMYTGCTSLSTHEWVAGYTGWTYPTNYKYEYLSWSWNNLKVYITRYEPLASGLTNSLGLTDTNVEWVYIYIDNLYNYMSNSYWSNISDNKFQAYYYDYAPHFTVDISKYTTLIWTYNMPWRWNSWVWSYSIWWWWENRRWVAPYDKNSYDVRVPWGKTNNNTGTDDWVIYTVRWEWTDWTAIDMNKDISVGTRYERWNIRNMYTDYKWKVTYWNAYYSSSNRPYKEVHWRVEIMTNEHYGGWLPLISASRDGRWLFVDGKKYYSSNRWWSWGEYWTYTGSYTSMEFSDDGLTAYLASDFWTITQYNLKAPRDLTTLTSTWKTLNISWSFAFSKDYKYLYVYDWSLKVYEYTA